MIKFALFYQNCFKQEVRIIDKVINNLSLNNKNIRTYYFLAEKNKFNYVKNSCVHFCPNLKYLRKNCSDRVYHTFLQFCIKKKIQYAFIPRLNYPEFFLNDLNFYKKINTKFVLMDQTFSLIRFSPIRAKVVIKLIKHRNVKKFIFDNLNGSEGKGPEYFEKHTKKISHKIIKWHQWNDTEPKILNKKKCRQKLKLPLNKFIILFFGFPFYGKGIDLIISAFKNLDKNFFLLLSSNLKFINFKYNFNNLKKYKKLRIAKIFNNYVSIKKREMVFGAADVVCLPYRKTYQYQSSGVLTESILFNKIFIAPDFNPFDQFIKKYPSLGLLFKSENIKSLVSALRKSKQFYLNKDYHKDREKYLINSSEANNLHKVILKVINPRANETL
jgi:glycosyltransferase involved in cell wall biosynthesis